MCGVAGIYAYGTAAAGIDRDELRRVGEHMAARGPDGEGEWYSQDGRVGLAHRRLAIIDLSARAAQPMATADGSVVISFNGEIYNHRELRAQLQAQGRTFRTESDTEVLLQLYEACGTGMLTQLRGMFAFALWDARKRAMLLARDPFGIKPLYYADDGRTLRVASQVKALLQAPVDTAPEPAGHAGFFLWGSVPPPWTLYRGIRCLQAGHSMWVHATGADAPQPYGDVVDVIAEAAANPARGTEQDAIDAVCEALRDSVRAHHVSDAPVGLFLSAGLDSTMLTALAAAGGAQPRTLTLAFAEYAGTASDEAPLASTTAARLHTRHSTVTLRREDFIGERMRLLAAMDQPSIDGINTWFVARAAAAQGMKVALSGLGGDELFASYPSFTQIPRLMRLARPFAALPGAGIAMRRISEPLIRHLTSPKYAGLLEYGGTAGGAYLLRRGLYMPWELPRVMDPDMAREGWRALQALPAMNDTAGRIGVTPGNRMTVSALEMTGYMRRQLLNDADWAGMAHSLEIRVPFVDVPLLKTVASWLAAHPGISKQQVAAALDPGLPRPLLQRRKTGFTVPLREWSGATSERGLRGWAQEVHAAQKDATSSRPRASASAPHAPRVLVSTLAPGHGGVSVMTQFVLARLRAMGLEPVVAHYAPYSQQPDLSVPSFRLLQRRTGMRRGLAHGHVSHAIGAWLPELEFTHFGATRHWRELMDGCEAFVAVSGNVLAATPFEQTQRPYLAWVATDWDGDRRDRVKGFPLVRRWLDTCVNSPVIRRLERRLLLGGRILALSEHTARELARIAGRDVAAHILPVAVDLVHFTPAPVLRVAGRIGFAGRFSDPRKNVDLMLQTLAVLRGRGLAAQALLIGDSPSGSLKARVHALGLRGDVIFASHVSRDALRDHLRTLDVFVLPSHQEGLCIAALEAMACGVPVVSTRCGGPEEFVIPGRTGDLVDANAADMAQALARLLSDTALRDRMGTAARALVEQRYSAHRVEAIFDEAFGQSFPGLAVSRQKAPAATADIVPAALVP